MNIGKLVRAKMKELAADCAGEYADNTGRHYTMKMSGEGYTVSYGGGKKEIDISREQAHMLAKNSKKLSGEEKKELAKKRLAAEQPPMTAADIKKYVESKPDKSEAKAIFEKMVNWYNANSNKITIGVDAAFQRALGDLQRYLR